MNGKADTLRFLPVTTSRWKDLEQLFGERGACGGCWCMSWRLAKADFEKGKLRANKAALAALVASGKAPGILAYDGKAPIGWCSVAPREQFDYLRRSRVLAPIDDKPVWSISCLFVRKEYRGQGVSVGLLKAAVDHVRKKGGAIVEGYPVIPYAARMPAAFAWTGTLSAFKRAGFTEAARKSQARPIMRYDCFKRDARTANASK
jgi:GNAT superfamily N-acetyltransferase